MDDDVEMSLRDPTSLMLTISDNPATDALVGAVDGQVLLPGDDGYAAECSPYNLAVAHAPAVVFSQVCGMIATANVPGGSSRRATVRETPSTATEPRGMR